MTQKTLLEWLDVIEKIHPLTMDFKMQRLFQVATKMALLKPNAFVITVAGTNGKGSTSTMISSLLSSLNLKVGLYTSPHLHAFNERIKINQKSISDQSLVDIFSVINIAREEVTLTYFEYATLAALMYFSEQECDVIVLEVGLGGRLDATNIIDADIAVITPIGIDHVAQLGDNLEAIAIEKAGIFRPQQTIILSEAHPPKTLIEMAHKHGANIVQRDCDFYVSKVDHSTRSKWNFHSISPDKIDFYFNELDAPILVGDHQYDNAACALATVLKTPFAINLTNESIKQGFDNAYIEGRLEVLESSTQKWLFDVTHNPHGAHGLVKWLKSQNYQNISVVVGMLNDKDALGLAQILSPFVSHWYFGSLEGERGQTAATLCDKMRPAFQENNNVFRRLSCFESIEDACFAAEENVQNIILVIGSFHTVASALKWYKGKIQ